MQSNCLLLLCNLLFFISFHCCADTGNTTLHIAAALGHRKMVKKLLAHRDINVTLLSMPLPETQDGSVVHPFHVVKLANGSGRASSGDREG